MKPKKVNRTTTPITMQLTADLVEELKAFASSRGETIRQTVELALRRHFASPPPLMQIPPLPPLVAVDPARGPRRSKPSSG